jgi:hypothetical protein
MSDAPKEPEILPEQLTEGYVKRLIASTMREAVEEGNVAFLPTQEQLRDFIRAEVKAALADNMRGLHLESSMARRRHGNR